MPPAAPREAKTSAPRLTPTPVPRLIVRTVPRRALALVVALACSAGGTARADPDPPTTESHKTVLQEIMLGQSARFRACYDDGRRHNLQLHGRVVTRFVVAPNGSVSETADRGSDLPDPVVVACIQAAIKELRFPEHDGGELAVVYPIDFEAPAPASAPTRSPSPIVNETPVQFEPSEPDLWLVRVDRQQMVVHEYEFRGGTYYESGADARYPIFCKGACRGTLARGRYELGLSKDGRDPVSAGVHAIDGPSTVRASYTDRRAIRVLGVAGGITGFLAGMALVVVSSDGSNIDGTGVAIGLAFGLATGIGGIALASQPDVARIDVIPLEAPRSRTPNEPPSALGAEPRGAALRVRF
jgi:hypothetical protein